MGTRTSKNGGDKPSHHVISQHLTEDIHRLYKPGDILPSESELCARFGVSRYIIRMAIKDMARAGLVGTYQGKGTIVLQQVIHYPIHAGTTFTGTLKSWGREAESKVLRKRGLPAAEDIAQSLEIEKDEPVIHVETLRLMDGVPLSISSHYFPLEKVFDVMMKYENGSLHDFIAKSCNIRLRRVQSLISAILPEQHTAELLEISTQSPVLQVKSVNVDIDSGIPIEYVISRFKGNTTELSVEPV